MVAAPGYSWQSTAISETSIGHKFSLFAAKVMAMTAIDLLPDAEASTQMWADFEERMKGLTYKSPLPPDLKPPLDQFEH